MSKIVFPEVGAPVVSIVMVTYGGREFVDDALRSVLRHTRPCYEVIVVDNASPDGTAEWLGQSVAGITLVLNDSNLGFGPASNQGALHARGRYLFFLNSDAFVQPGWLGPLLEVAERDPAVAVVAPCLVEPDGRLQEAAGLLGGDGFAGQLGLGGDASQLEYLFRREVDFASAAALLVRRRDFLAVGGFDPAYRMGYFEDVDLCLTFWDRGLSTVYEPRSRVVHLRGASGSVEIAQRYAEANHSVLMRRWGHELDGRPWLGSLESRANRVAGSRDARALDRVLVITERVPSWQGCSTDRRAATLVADFALLWPSARVTVVAVDGSGAHELAPPLVDLGVEVVCGQNWPSWFDGRLFHYSVVFVAGPQLFESFDHLLSRTQPQALRVQEVRALSFRFAGHGPERPPGAGNTGLGAPLSPRAAAAERAWARLRAVEIAAAERSAAVLCVSPHEAGMVRDAGLRTTIFTFPPAPFALGDTPGFAPRAGVVFTGDKSEGVGSPDVDSAEYLAQEILPTIRERDWSIQAQIAGVEPAVDVRALQGSAVEIVPAARPALDRARVLVAPFRFCTGVAPQLVESMSAGLPFVTTPIGAQGLDLRDLEPFVVAEGPSQLAALTLALHGDAELWEWARARLLALAGRYSDGEARRGSLVDAMSHVGMAPPR